eukprot:8739825-Alexandrium_andersonii.AAC.1
MSSGQGDGHFVPSARAARSLPLPDFWPLALRWNSQELRGSSGISGRRCGGNPVVLRRARSASGRR